MIYGKRKIQLVLMFGVLFFCFFNFVDISLAQQASQEKTEGLEEDKIIPSPKDIKEQIAIYVFLGWMWLAILVLIYFLRLKVKEVDRLYKIKFFSESEK